jgi:Xaa-Pro aminopeptidase
LEKQNLFEMFAKEVYVRRRAALLQKMQAAGQSGLVLFIGNAEAPAQYKDNCYKWRQDSSWLYFFGLDEPLMAATLDIDTGVETLFADDVDIDDIIWMGPQPSVRSKAEAAGMAHTAPYAALSQALSLAHKSGRDLHYLAPSRYFNTLRLMELTQRARVERYVSKPLTEAVISLRLIKEDIEIEAIDRACDLGFQMHSVARDSIVPGIVEQDIVGKMEGVALAKGWGVSFPTILTQHGETLHNHLHDKVIEPGKLMVVDAGVESNEHYASDFTRTYPTSGRFTQKQREVYQIVYECNELAFSLTRPGITYREVHLATARKMLEGLSGLGLVKGDLDEMVACGIAGLFQPHGLGHNMGLDVHDMEDLGENLVGYDPDQKRAKQLGLGSLRMARRLCPGHVITDEPGIYFIPALIEKFKKEGLGKDFVNYAKLEGYYDFGGIRLEDDVLVTPTGARRLGPSRLPIAPEDVEAAMAK